MPRDTNERGTIFGGVLLSYIDLAGAVEAAKRTERKIVTVAMHEVVFHHPVFVGDLVSFYTETVRTGTTSITVRVLVEARPRERSRAPVDVTEAVVVYVAVDAEGRPTPVGDQE